LSCFQASSHLVVVAFNAYVDGIPSNLKPINTEKCMIGMLVLKSNDFGIVEALAEMKHRRLAGSLRATPRQR
jgi:hypothetical protein